MNIARGLKEFFERMQHDVLLVTGKKSAESVGALVSGTMTPLTIPTLGLAAGVSAALTQIEYHHKTKEIKELYKEELAAKLHKSPSQVAKTDLHILARGDSEKGVAANGVINEALGKNRKVRNVGIGISVLSTLGSLTLTHMLAHSAVGIAMFGAMAPAAAIITQMALALVVYNTIKKPLKKLGHVLFGLDKKTTHDRIVDIKRDREDGRSITKEQVFSVFAGANQELGTMIAHTYGKGFDELEVGIKHTITENLGQLLHIGAIADAINKGAINVTELAFTVEGQASGVLPKTEPQPRKWSTLATRLKNGIAHVFKRHSTDGHAHETLTLANAGSSATGEQGIAVEYKAEQPHASFVERLGLSSKSTPAGHVERIEQVRSEQFSATTQR